MIVPSEHLKRKEACPPVHYATKTGVKQGKTSSSAQSEKKTKSFVTKIKGVNTMSKTLISENDVKKALAIDSFRNISKDKIMEFVSLIPNMDKDLAIAIVNQFPAYTEFATTAITVLKDMCDSVLEKGEASHMETLAAYRKLLDDLGEMAKRENITEEERKFLTEQMIIVADKIGEKDTEFKNFISGVLKYGTTILSGAIIIGAAILGVNIKGKDIPVLKK